MVPDRIDPETPIDAPVDPVTPFTVKSLRDVVDVAPSLGVDAVQDVRFAGEDLGAATIGVALMGVKPGQRQAVAHRHDEAEEVYVVVAGSGRIKLDDEIRDVKPMDAIRIAPHVVRAVEAGPDGIEYLAFGPRHDGDGETFPPERLWGDPAGA